ncbi:MAG: DNA mismatch repair endonuclease MutL [Fimbriimonadaceae bacterium]|nr:DNA mismatch repair endonuclease MutL [Fimbriimonadaceae bacterium]
MISFAPLLRPSHITLIISHPRIRLLDSHTVNQIAAGEVVERPAAALKELVENALDAGATKIEIELIDSGKALICVRDNGRGMSLEDAELALQRHATSKIGSVDDLTHVGTLGFRGEALPSIASVSHMTLTTAESDGLRTQFRIVGGEVEPVSRIAGPKGTEVLVEELFFNTPARLKFLKSDTTELGQCMDVVSKYAIAYPNVSFTMVHNGQSAVRTNGSGNMLEAIADVWSRDLARSLAEVDTEIGGMRIHGFVSPPHVNRPTRAYQYLYVNGRPVRTRSLTAAMDQAYRDLTPDRRYPVIALMVDVDPTRVDVNVSPTKSEVKFQAEGQAFDAIRVAIKSALMQHGMMPSADGVAAANEALRAAERVGAVEDWRIRSTGVVDQALVEFGASETFPLSRTSDPNLLLSAPLPASGISTPNQLNGARYPFGELLDGLRVLGQSMNTFILAETKRGIVIVDQHVAHERILYEYLCGLKGESAIERQPLLVPQTLHLDRRSAVLLRERLHEVTDVGFDLEPFGGESYVVRAVPAAIRSKDPLKILRDMVDELVDASVARRLVPTREQIWITTACHMAVKAGDPLSHAEMEKLIVDLATTENPYMCPHGRPITITLTVEDLMRKFKRT